MAKGKTHGRTTIRDVSRLADVSVATVSAVINGKPAVSETLTRQVRRAIEALNYQPDYLARSLRMQRSNILGIVMPQIASSYYSEVLRGVEDAHQGKDAIRATTALAGKTASKFVQPATNPSVGPATPRDRSKNAV